MMRVLVCGSSLTANGQDLKKLWQEHTYDYVIGADRGTLFLLDEGIRVDEAVGDFDSISEEQFKRIESMKIRIERYPAEKDETDLDIAVRSAMTRSPNEVHIFGATGGRFDHTMAALETMLRYQKQYTTTFFFLKDEKNEISIMFPGVYNVQYKDEFPYVSFFSLHETVHQLSLKGFKYPVISESISTGESKFTSNEILDPTASISFKRGICLMIRSKD